jgi:Asp-tRNA(Asn)/Glu-tRNA(Gln) amidotransferase A subunit family amidase
VSAAPATSAGAGRGQGREELTYLDAGAALALFAAGELSPVEYMEAAVARAEAVGPAVNAFADTFFDEAMAAAREAESRYAAGAARPLEGIPVAVKEAQPLAGHPVTDGLLDPPGQTPAPAAADAFAVARLREAGAIVHARTTTSELCCMPVSHSLRWGVTRNPWHLEMSAGGSSGGSAAALAAGLAPLATGGDIGGSLRAPACLAGVVGYKPPHGRVPLEPPANEEAWLVTGPMARSVADAALLADAMAGPHPLDPRSLPRVDPLSGGLGSAEGMRIAVCARPGDFPVAAAVADRVTALAGTLAAAGLWVEEIELPGWELAAVKAAQWGHGDQSRARDALAAHPERALSPYAVECFRRSLAAAAALDPERRAALERELADRVYAVFERFDALVLPTMGVAATVAGEDYVEAPLVVDGEPLDHFCDAALTPIFNIASECPVLSVPAGLVPAPRPGRSLEGAGSPGVPTGVQVVGPRLDDRAAFRLAAAIEELSPWNYDFGGGTK